jgi:predicted DCC family thiol-disulfide oxidoreductase YuxK
MSDLKVYYDGACPVCSREIDYYRRSGAEAEAAIEWIDASRAGAESLGPALTRDAALRRMHVRRADGSLASGAAAFVEIWRSLPRFRWLARLIGTPPLLWAAEGTYRLFLAIRPLWRRKDKR